MYYSFAANGIPISDFALRSPTAAAKFFCFLLSNPFPSDIIRNWYAGVSEWQTRLTQNQLSFGRAGSSPATGTTSEQALYRLLRLFYKSQSALMPLLLLSKLQPLRWVAIWFRVLHWKRQHLYCFDVTAQKFPPPFRFRLAAKTALWWEFLRSRPGFASLDSGPRKTGDAGCGLHLLFVTQDKQ